MMVMAPFIYEEKIMAAVKWKNIVWEDGSDGPPEGFDEAVVKLTWNAEAGWYEGEYWVEVEETAKAVKESGSALAMVRRLLGT